MGAFGAFRAPRWHDCDLRCHHRRPQPGAELTRVFFQDIRVQGNTMGSREDFARLLRFVEHADIHPVIDSTFGLADARAAFAKVLSGDVFGKVVVRI